LTLHAFKEVGVSLLDLEEKASEVAVIFDDLFKSFGNSFKPLLRVL
jgi:hypothetical protein